MIQQQDFDEGTLIITTPGEYFFAEDVVFSPRLANFSSQEITELQEPELFMFPTDEQRTLNGRAYNLGFFAAIVVAADNVVIDLNGYSLSQSHIHGAVQRFFSLIELANSPFPGLRGPANFTTVNDFRPAVNVTIRNGSLGNSVHHGVHGNNCKNILFENIVVSEFQVAGISLNAADNVVFKNVTVENSRRDERYNARISHIIFSLQALTLHIEPNISLEVLSSSLKSEILVAREELREILREVIAFEAEIKLYNLEKDYRAINAGLRALHPMVRTYTRGLPDGSLMAGIVLHATVNVDEFMEEFPEDAVENVIFENVVVRNLASRPIELTGVSKDGSALRDMIGAGIDIDSIRDLSSPTLAYKANPLAEFQLLLGKLKEEVELTVPQTVENEDAFRLLSRGNTPTELLAWREGSITWDEVISQRSFEVFPNGDVMFHFNKGVIGIKIDQAINVKMQNVRVENLENLATEEDRSYFFQNLPLSGVTSDSFIRENYQITERPYFGFGVRGIALAANVQVQGDVSVSSLFSNFELQRKAVEYINLNEGVSLEVVSADKICTETAELPGLLAPFERFLPFVKRDEFDYDVPENFVFVSSTKPAQIVGILFVISIVAVVAFICCRKDFGNKTDIEKKVLHSKA